MAHREDYKPAPKVDWETLDANGAPIPGAEYRRPKDQPKPRVRGAAPVGDGDDRPTARPGHDGLPMGGFVGDTKQRRRDDVERLSKRMAGAPEPFPPQTTPRVRPAPENARTVTPPHEKPWAPKGTRPGDYKPKVQS